jgi:hypothetical protein
MEQVMYPETVLPAFVSVGAEYRTYEPESLTDVTPGYWGDNAQHRYLLQMKKTPKAGVLHIISGENLPVVGVTTSLKPVIENFARDARMDHIHIPAHQDIVPISFKLPNRNVEVGAIVMSASAELLTLMLDQGLRESS